MKIGIINVGDKNITIYVFVSTFTQNERDEFIMGWEDAGGYMGDINKNKPFPLCAPWTYCGKIKFDLESPIFYISPYELGQKFWNKLKEKIKEKEKDNELLPPI